MRKFKTVLDIDLVFMITDKFDGMSLRSMYRQKAIELFKDLHFLHLLNINSQYGKKIIFNKEFKEFLSSEIGVSYRTIENWMKRLIVGGEVEKIDGVHKFTGNLKTVFKRN